jgi:hypothetical protein
LNLIKVGGQWDQARGGVHGLNSRVWARARALVIGDRTVQGLCHQMLPRLLPCFHIFVASHLLDAMSHGFHPEPNHKPGYQSEHHPP